MFILRPDLRWADLKATVDLRAKYICFINLWCWLSVLIYLECRSGWWSAGGQWHRDLRSAHVTLKQHQLFIGAERIKWHPGLKTENSSLSDPVMWWWRCAEYESINLIFTVRADISPIQNIHMTWSMSAGHRSGRFFFFYKFIINHLKILNNQMHLLNISIYYFVKKWVRSDKTLTEITKNNKSKSVCNPYRVLQGGHENFGWPTNWWSAQRSK